MPEPEHEPTQEERTRQQYHDAFAQEDAERDLGRRRGCGIPAIAAGVIIAVVGAVAVAHQLNSNDEICGGQRRNQDGLALIACSKSDEAASSDTATETSPSEASSSAANSGGRSAGGGGTALVPPPDPATLPPGTKLFTGESGDQIGYIFQDGQPRYIALDHPGVIVGLRDAQAIAIDIGPGRVTSFGANFHTASNNGRYGINLYRVVKGPTADADSDFRSGCVLEIGETSCTLNIGAPIVAGDKVAIVIGEAGNPGARGDYTMDWWFVWQPA